MRCPTEDSIEHRKKDNPNQGGQDEQNPDGDWEGAVRVDCMIKYRYRQIEAFR